MSSVVNALNSYPRHTASTNRTSVVYQSTHVTHYDAIATTYEHTAAAEQYWLCAQEAGENGLLGGSEVLS